MKKNKKKNKFRVIYLLLLILLTGIMLTTSTYAWFTVNRIVYIDSLSVKVEAQGGIEISADGTTWKSSLTSEDLTLAKQNYSASVNQLPNKLEPVSTGGLVDSSTGFLNMYYGTVTNDNTGNYILTTERSIEASDNADGKFIAFDLFLRVNRDSNLYLTNESKAIYTGDKVPGIENAVRFAFVIEGNTSSGSSLGTIQSLRGATDNDVYIWEPNYDVHSDTAIRNAADVYGITVGNSSNNKLSYDGVIKEFGTSANILINKASASEYPNLFKTVNIAYATIANFSDYQQIFNLKNGITKVRVYIWLEGQDVDCENNSAIGNIDFNFQFSTNPSLEKKGV